MSKTWLLLQADPRTHGDRLGHLKGLWTRIERLACQDSVSDSMLRLGLAHIDHLNRGGSQSCKITDREEERKR